MNAASATPFCYREAQRNDIPEMARIWGERKSEGGASQERMMAYFDGSHHPQHALPPRVIYVAMEGDILIGYAAGHLTRRYACDGELQWIYVLPARRGCGVASELLRRLAAWFQKQHAFRICVNVDPANTVARNFYIRSGAEQLNPHWLVWNHFGVLEDGTSFSKTCPSG